MDQATTAGVFGDLQLTFQPPASLNSTKQRLRQEFSGSGPPKEVTEVDVTGVYYSVPSVVPSFDGALSHWGVVVGRTLYHLVFQKDIASQKPIGIMFNYQPSAAVQFTVKGPLGKTTLTHDQLAAVGEALIIEFGTYHQVFWNCQHFANCLLEVICAGNFTRITTSAEVLRTLMFGSIVAAPLATSRAWGEHAKRQKTVAQTRHAKGTAEETAEKKSDDIISKLIPTANAALKEPCVVM
eukprot:TRINITY_DN16922_c0_g1_i1.p1 TRINITY_DN16922_c0_g1~~TRINITY_DN16922_c0_g1_i1.p1  ORF type:complete len:239 (-),score=36.83 TRINITY_DN16922_c0_g1_i1:101-817(-)